MPSVGKSRDGVAHSADIVAFKYERQGAQPSDSKREVAITGVDCAWLKRVHDRCLANVIVMISATRLRIACTTDADCGASVSGKDAAQARTLERLFFGWRVN